MKQNQCLDLKQTAHHNTKHASKHSQCRVHACSPHHHLNSLSLHVSSNDAEVDSTCGRDNGALDDTTIDGGNNNTAKEDSIVEGGRDNVALDDAAIGGGSNNTAREESFVGGGADNDAEVKSAVSGGIDNNTFRVQVFEGEFDDEGVYFYQAFNDKIAEYALKHQTFGGPNFNPQRMTWIKPSFAWVLYRSGYGYKKNQTRILKVKLSHDTVATILSRCTCCHAGWRGSKIEECLNGRIQWDPARDLYSADKKVPRKMLSTRAIQIGVARSLSSFYVESILKITDVTQLAHQVCLAHCMRKRRKAKELMEELKLQLPVERPYLPQCQEHILKRLGMLPGKEARALAQIGRGMVTLAPKSVTAPTKHGEQQQQKPNCIEGQKHMKVVHLARS